MALFTAKETRFAKAIQGLTVTNPFLPERLAAERAILGKAYVDYQEVWSIRQDLPEEGPNVLEIARRTEALAAAAAGRRAEGKEPSPAEATLFADLVVYVLYDRCQRRFSEKGRPSFRALYGRFEREAAELFGDLRPEGYESPHLFALFFQVHTAFQEIFRFLVGTSMAGARLRAAVWQSIFTHDLRRYQRILFSRMGDLNTLVTGPSGTGKELVARAIGRARYVPFDPKTGKFASDVPAEVHTVNLSALSPTLIESELFGHRRGAFTGALTDRAGWFAVCGNHGAVFLDEIGEVDPAIQVKLLRVLESRTFVRLGGKNPRRFEGKVVAATNRDLATEMRAGRFREDLYYRLCSDVIVTPSLAEQLAECPDDLADLVSFVVGRVAGEASEDLVTDVIDWIENELGRGYAWPGNFRELEQCVKNVMVRREYRPASPAGEDLSRAVAEGRLTADELIRRYVTLVYAQTGSYEGAARRLKLDRRTVKSKVDPELP